MTVATSSSDITVESLGCLGSERTGTWPATFAKDVDNLEIEIDIFHSEADHLGPAKTAVYKETKHRHVPAFLKTGALTCPQ
jgi:hypothetical protein